MPRSTSGPKTRQRRKKVLKLAKGYWGAKSKLFRTATEAVDKALCYAYRDRKQKKRQFRSLWIARISAAVRQDDLTYSRFISGLKQINCDLNRKVLAEMAVSDPDGFKKLVTRVKETLNTASAA